MVEVVRRRKAAETIHHRLAHDGKQKVHNYEAEVTQHQTRTVTCVHLSGSQNQWGSNDQGSKGDRDEY